jgi:hypothetical protein
MIPHQACEEWKSCFLTVIREAIAKYRTPSEENLLSTSFYSSPLCC